MTEKFEMSKQQLDMSNRVAVHDKQIEILVADFQKSRDKVEEGLIQLTTNISNLAKSQNDFINRVPFQMQECRQQIETDIEQLETDILDVMKKEYVTHNEFKSMKVFFAGCLSGCTILLGVFDYLITKTNLFT